MWTSVAGLTSMRISYALKLCCRSFSTKFDTIAVNTFGINILDCSSDAETVEIAAQCISTGGVIGVPTDTIYGLAAAAQNPEAVEQLYNIKDRDPSKPISICVDKVDSVALWGDVSPLPAGLLQTLLPGPVTVVLTRTPSLNPLLNPSNSKVGIRIPDHRFIRNLCSKIFTPLALTSANTSKEPSSLSPEEFKHLWPKLSAVFHGGCLGDSPERRAGSTIVDLSIAGKYSIVREGSALIPTKRALENFGLLQSR